MTPSTHLRTYLLSTLYGIALVSFMVLGTFVRLMADDYCIPVVMNQYGLLGSVDYWYQNWTGRYSDVFLKGLFSYVDVEFYPLLTACMILGLWTAIAVFLRALLRWHRIPRFNHIALLLSTFITFGIIDGAVSRQSIYWSAASITYILPLIILIIAATCAFHLIFSALSRSTLFGLTTLLIVSLVIVAGMPEIYPLFTLVFSVFLALWGSLTLTGETRRRLGVVIGLIIVISLCALLFALTAPGNYVRRDAQDASFIINNPVELGFSIIRLTILLFTSELYGLVHFFAAFFTSLVLWITAIESDVLTSAPAPNRLYQAFGLSAFVAFGLVCVSIAPQMYGTGLVVARSAVQARAIQISLFALWGYWAAVGLSRNRTFKRLQHRPIYRMVKWEILAVLVIVPSIVLVRHIALVGDFATFARQWDARHAMLIAARNNGNTEIVVTPLDYNLEEYLVLDRMEKAEWVYKCVVDYYDVDFKLLNPPDTTLPENSN